MRPLIDYSVVVQHGLKFVIRNAGYHLGKVHSVYVIRLKHSSHYYGYVAPNNRDIERSNVVSEQNIISDKFKEVRKNFRDVPSVRHIVL